MLLRVQVLMTLSDDPYVQIRGEAVFLSVEADSARQQGIHDVRRTPVNPTAKTVNDADERGVLTLAIIKRASSAPPSSIPRISPDGALKRTSRRKVA